MIDFIIIGAQKAGTTAALHNLNSHPEISMFMGVTEYSQRELEFFNQHWEMGVDWYHKQLPCSDGLVGEKTAELLHRTICHRRIYVTNPNVKLIVILRCPIRRAHSQWRMAVRDKADEQRSFEDVISQEMSELNTRLFKANFYKCVNRGLSCWREGYLIKGLYHEQLLSLFRYFPRKNIHIATTESILRDMEYEYNRMFSFLGVSILRNQMFKQVFVGKGDKTIKQSTQEMLQSFYSKPNKRLCELLGTNFREWQV